MPPDFSFESLKRRLLAGSDRLPASEHVSPEVVTAALASENLRRKAGFSIPRIDGAAMRPDPAPEPRWPPAGLGAALKHILSGMYLPALPEYLDHLRAQGFDIPHEYLPALLDHLARTPASAERCRPLPGARAAWLMAQHPVWKDLYAWETADFFHLAGDDRERLFRLTRRTDPGKAGGWLEACWHEESAKQKRRFLNILEIGLGEADLPLLERACADKQREVRHDAARLCARLRTGTVYETYRSFVRENLRGEGLLARRMQGVTLEQLAPAAYFTEDAAKAQLPVEVLRLLLTTLHAGDWVHDLEFGTPEAFFAQLDPLVTLPWAMEGLLLHNDEAGTRALFDWLGKNHAPECWSAPALYRLACRFPEHTGNPGWQGNLKAGVFYEVLAALNEPWPDGLFLRLLQSMVLRYPRGEDLTHLQAALQTASWHAPAVSARKALQTLPPEMRSARELLRLEDVLVFRGQFA